MESLFKVLPDGSDRNRNAPPSRSVFHHKEIDNDVNRETHLHCKELEHCNGWQCAQVKGVFS